MKNLAIKTIAILTLASLLYSCNKDEAPLIPVLPPESSLSMNFDDFKNEKSTNLFFENWLYSVLSVSFFNTLSATYMVVPTAAFNASFTQTPTYIGDQTWQWSYQVPVIGATYTARLNGITEKKNKVRWEMYIDKAGPNGFDNFLWLEGTSADSTAVTWKIYDNPEAPKTVLEIEWESNADRTETSLKYTYTKSNDQDANSYIKYGKTPEGTFNRYYNIYMSNSNIDIDIEWNSTNKNGRVKSPNHYKDQIWHCWNEKLLDDFCD